MEIRDQTGAISNRSMSTLFRTTEDPSPEYTICDPEIAK